MIVRILLLVCLTTLRAEQDTWLDPSVYNADRTNSLADFNRIVNDQLPRHVLEAKCVFVTMLTKVRQPFLDHILLLGQVPLNKIQKIKIKKKSSVQESNK